MRTIWQQLTRTATLLPLVGFALLATLLLTPAARAEFPGANGLIAFGAYPTPNAPGRQVFTIAPKGTGLRQITSVDGDVQWPHWSPNGNQIVFEFDHPNGACSIELMNFDGSGLTDLTQDDPNICENSPSFTPDGSRIIFDRYDGYTNDEGLWTMDLTGGDRHEITPNRCCVMPEVSPNGTTVSFEGFNPNGDGQAIFTCALSGNTCGDLHQLTGYSDICDKQDWAPDGSRIVLTENCDYQNGQSANIATIKPDGTDLQLLTNFTGGHTGVISGSYSPDGQWIVYRLDNATGNRYSLWKMRPDGTQRHLIANLPFKPRNIDWGTHP
jgi:Tol biopolymer transport system component